MKMAYDDLEFSQKSFVFFTSWEGTHLKELKCLLINHIYNTSKDKKTWIKNWGVVSLKPTAKRGKDTI